MRDYRPVLKYAKVKKQRNELLQVLKDIWQCGDSIRHDSVIWLDVRKMLVKAEKWDS